MQRSERCLDPTMLALLLSHAWKYPSQLPQAPFPHVAEALVEANLRH